MVVEARGGPSDTGGMGQHRHSVDVDVAYGINQHLGACINVITKFIGRNGEEQTKQIGWRRGPKRPSWKALPRYNTMRINNAESANLISRNTGS